MQKKFDDYKVVKYSKEFYSQWNDFILNSKNGTFLFHRDFMEYHSDRFEDFSILIFYKGKLQAVLPANVIGGEIHSHQGLTYGGLVLVKEIKFEGVLELFKLLLKFYFKAEIKTVYIKQIPFIYTSFFNEELEYLMFIVKAELVKKETLSVISQCDKLGFSKGRLEGFKRGRKYGLVIKEEQDLSLFWNEILLQNLKKKHNAKPVHSLEEITLLKGRFPKNIRQFNVYHDNNIVAGTTIFESKHVAHSQYISGNDDKNRLGSLDILHVYLIEEVFKSKRYFDFGISNENKGLNVNKGLQFWKEGFGARTVTQNFYKVETKNYSLFEKLFV
ncbi:GNAT family N-acetyltransferase [Aestuariibaculum sp. YM273]|uniref:GNAT family N-acetyltransferase n=1 Tax=Aestuariibaculum sp. YM273 TaxID=3070659 RepID=UPI0027DE8C0C|nr:GNAT family N-acetyltransferase [Aestuariibaculum sp. YM273]WMI65931.1 GNAT family N-acetyltransferase [Aestuariibaculum sp. YM273]